MRADPKLKVLPTAQGGLGRRTAHDPASAREWCIWTLRAGLGILNGINDPIIAVSTFNERIATESLVFWKRAERSMQGTPT